MTESNDFGQQASPPSAPPPPAYGQQPTPPPGFGAPPPYAQQPPPAYGQQPPPYSQPMYGGSGGQMSNGLGIAALICGILAILLSITVAGGFILGILGLVFGIIGRKRAARGEASNGGMALAGAICGGIGLVASIAIIGAGVSLFNHNKHDLNTYQSCLSNAQSLPPAQQPAAVTNCEQRFFNNLNN